MTKLEGDLVIDPVTGLKTTYTPFSLGKPVTLLKRKTFRLPFRFHLWILKEYP